MSSLHHEVVPEARCPGCETAITTAHAVRHHAGESWHAECLDVMIRNCVQHFVRHLFNPGHPRRMNRSKEFLDRVTAQIIGLADEERCHVCGCTYEDPCENGCAWVSNSFCSACSSGGPE